jgi:hypothetical protein
VGNRTGSDAGFTVIIIIGGGGGGGGGGGAIDCTGRVGETDIETGTEMGRADDSWRVVDMETEVEVERDSI